MKPKRTKKLRGKTLKDAAKTKVILARGTDMVDPEKRAAIFNQMLDELGIPPEDEAAERVQVLIDEGIEFGRRGVGGHHVSGQA